MKYSSSDIEKMKSELNIVEVVGEYVDLKRAGANFKGLCPFHKDSNPSFMVSPSKNICKCFVCGAGGDPVKFYMEHNKLTFPQTMKELNDKYSMGIAPKGGYDSNYSDINTKYQEIVEDAMEYYKQEIFSNEGREALAYLGKRQFDPQFVVENSIGFAPKGWNNLSDHLLSKGHELRDLITLGLVKEGEKGHYDAFRNRVMFPIFSPNGSVIAFGGRTLEDRKDVPKYINSPESPIFHKGQNLYGIKERGSIIRRKAYSILMEGYMDVLAAHAYGFDVSVASLGTAFTDDQGKLLKRYTSNVIIAFDMDSAGRAAAEKTAIVLKSHGFNIRVLELVGAKDPDEYLKKYGKQEFLKCVKNSKEVFDFLYDFYVKEYDLSNLMAKRNLVDRFKLFFQNVETELEKTLYIDKLSKSLEIDKELLKDILITNNKKQAVKNQEVFRVEKKKNKGINKLELDSLRVVLYKPELLRYFKDRSIQSDLVLKIFDLLIEGELQKGRDISGGNLIKRVIKEDILTGEEKQEIIEIGASSLGYANEDVLNRVFLETILGWLRSESKELAEKCRGNSKMLEAFKVRRLQEELKRENITLGDLERIDEELNILKF